VTAIAVIPGQPAGLNPESRDSGSALRASRNDGSNPIDIFAFGMLCPTIPVAPIKMTFIP